MPYLGKDAVEVACPSCGERQLQPRTAYSTICKACHAHFRLHETPDQTAPPQGAGIKCRTVCCFECGGSQEVPQTAASSMCKRCGSHIDLGDYRVTKAVTQSYRTNGRLVIEEKGYLLNTDAIVGEAVVKGRVIGRLEAKGALEIHSSATITGAFSAGRLVVPPKQHFRWPEPLQVRNADIAGELVADLCASGTVRLRSTSRLFGNVQALNFVVAAGAVFVGSARIGAWTRRAGDARVD